MSSFIICANTPNDRIILKEMKNDQPQLWLAFRGEDEGFDKIMEWLGQALASGAHSRRI